MVVPAPTRARLEAICRQGGEAVGSVYAIVDDPADAAALRELEEEHPGLAVLCNGAPTSAVSSCNRGLLLRTGDALLARGDDPPPLAAMLALLDGEDRAASVSAGTNVLLRDWVLNAAGCLDPGFTDLAPALAEWEERARLPGLVHLRVPLARPAGPVRVWIDLESLPAPARGAGEALAARLRELPEMELASTQQRCDVCFRPGPITRPAHLARLLDGPGHLVIAAGGARPDPLLFAAAQAAQAVIVPSEAERATLLAALALAPGVVEVAQADDAERLAAIFRRLVDEPSPLAAGQRRLLANFACWPAR